MTPYITTQVGFILIFFQQTSRTLHTVKKMSSSIHNLFTSLQVSTHNAKKKIAESTATYMDFLQQYDELKSRK